MRTKKRVPPLEVLNLYQRGVLQDGYCAPYPKRVQVLYELYVLCGNNISLVTEFLKTYYPCFPIANRNSLALMIKRHDSFSIAIKMLEEDTKLYSKEMEGALDDETLSRLLWKLRRKIYLRNVTEPSGSAIDLEECA